MNTTMAQAPATQKAKKRLSKEVAFATSIRSTVRDLRQLDLFADDPVGAEALLDIVAESQQEIQVVLEENPALAAAMADSETVESVNFAHLMRTEGASVDETHMVLADAGEDADAVMAHLAVIERAAGVPEAAQEVAVDEGMAVDIESELGDLESDRDNSDATASTKKDKKAKSDDTAETAFKSLMSQIRGPRYAPLTVEQEFALYTKIRNGETEAIRLAARNELCDHNMRFLVAAARRFGYTGRPLDILVAYGTTGLINAAQKFDPARGRFTTCAAVWIRQSIQRALGTDSIMKTPAYMPVKESRLRREAEASRDPVEKVRLTAEADELAGEIKARRATHVSLDGGQDDDSDSGGNMLSMFASECAGPDEQMERRQLITQLVKTAKRLGDDRETDIFLMRLGLHEDYVGEPKTLSEVSEIFDISRERVRQVYNGAAEEVAKSLAFWANGAENLPEGFRKGLMSPGRC